MLKSRKTRWLLIATLVLALGLAVISRAPVSDLGNEMSDLHAEAQSEVALRENGPAPTPVEDTGVSLESLLPESEVVDFAEDVAVEPAISVEAPYVAAIPAVVTPIRRPRPPSVPRESVSQVMEDSVSKRSIASVLEDEASGRATPKATKGRAGRVSARVGFRSARLKAYDIVNRAQARLVSHSIFDVGLGYFHAFTKSITSKLFFEMSRFNWVQPTRNATLEMPSHNLYAFGADVFYEMSPRFTLNTGFSMRQHVYLRGIEIGRIRMDPVFVPRLNVGASYDLIEQRARFGLLLEGFASYDLPLSSPHHEIRAGHAYGLALMASHRISERLRSQAGLSFSETHEDSSIVTQKRSDVGLVLRVAMDIGEDDEKVRN